MESLPEKLADRSENEILRDDIVCAIRNGLHYYRDNQSVNGWLSQGLDPSRLRVIKAGETLMCDTPIGKDLSIRSKDEAPVLVDVHTDFGPRYEPVELQAGEQLFVKSAYFRLETGDLFLEVGAAEDSSLGKRISRLERPGFRKDGRPASLRISGFQDGEWHFEVQDNPGDAKRADAKQAIEARDELQQFNRVVMDYRETQEHPEKIAALVEAFPVFQPGEGYCYAHRMTRGERMWHILPDGEEEEIEITEYLRHINGSLYLGHEIRLIDGLVFLVNNEHGLIFEPFNPFLNRPQTVSYQTHRGESAERIDYLFVVKSQGFKM